MLTQFKAGYIVDSIAKVITDFKTNLDNNPSDSDKVYQINGILHYVSSFDVEFPYNHTPDYKKLSPILTTLNNIITRGLPTRAPVFIENLFTEIRLTEPNIDEFEFNFPKSKKPINYETIFELLHIIEPKLEIDRKHYDGNIGSEGEWHFLNEELKKQPYAKQILQSQREFATINKSLGGGRSVDFSFEFPYLNFQHTNSRKKGIIFEFDGSHHKINSYKYYDTYRDNAAEEEGFETLRQSSDRIDLDQSIINQFKKDIFQKIFKKNFERDITQHLEEYSLIFIPLAVARIQKTILEFLLVHPDFFEKDKIIIGIIERDLPCGAIAIKTLTHLFQNINAILEDKDKLVLPKISLTIFENSKWVIDGRLHLQIDVQNEDYFKQNYFDIVIDHSILRRSNIYKETDYQNENSIKIRSSHYCDTSFGKNRRVYCADLLHYKPLVTKLDDGSYIPITEYEENINFFIQNIFRKIAYREGQLPIISRALQQKPVIGLLPTGGGKSLTYQLPVFLQPGLCLVVDPIKSLMEDQVRVLKENWIDCCDFINSNLNHEKKAEKLIDFRYGEIMFLFISPERFVMEDIRKIIYSIDVSKFGLAFSYCVIDEVHCVSEWGHDFRSTYLMLGKNVQQFTKTKNTSPVSLIGLTATASFDVLADIERELKIQHDDVAEAIIMIENTIRPELFFRTINVNDNVRIESLNSDFSKIGANLQKINNLELLEQSIKDHKDNFAVSDISADKYLIQNNEGKIINLTHKSQNDLSAIVFCPVKGTGGHLHGVDSVYKNLASISKGYFYSTEINDEKEEVQKHFLNFTTGKTKHIVCTKAFGMGIDKKDIRSTYHFVYSGSLESLVQEAGRSGRDKKIAEANILVSTKSNFIFDVYAFFCNNVMTNILLQKNSTRKAIRQAFERQWDDDKKCFETKQDVLDTIEIIDFSLTKKDGSKYNILSPQDIATLRILLKQQDENNNYKYILEKHEDRGIHDYFHHNSFKGIDTERSQFLSLFKIKEFQLDCNENIVDIENQDTLANTFENCKDDTFQFIITATKKYPDPIETICKILGVDPNGCPPYPKKTNKECVNNAYKYSHSHGFIDFLLLLDENNVKALLNITEEMKAKLLFVYCRDRETSNDTGRLIYRMHSMGLLTDYLIDYNKNNLYTCTFKKYSSINEYISEIEKYLRRYLSENKAIESIKDLKKRLTKSNLINNILECLYFLSEFSYKEIANKRKRATDEIENILNESITNPVYTANWYKQNHYIKEQIYFYFNAKYARIAFKISGQPYSLLDDYQGQSMNKEEILNKYLDVFHLDGTEQNNYKHMMGSCKKILRSLSETDLKNEWLLHLLKAFSMYSINNASYISEANTELELGFDNLYNDEQFHDNDFVIIEPIFETYFQRLQNNIQVDNPSFKDIKLIRTKLLLKMQSIGIKKLIDKNNELEE
jgi:ATP-dependent DNA helicase RecQ